MVRLQISILQFLLFLSISQTLASNINIKKSLEIPSPHVKSFLKNEYGAENQNWDISAAESGNIYFANSLGLLKFDGEDWELFQTDEILRAVYCSGDTIFVGGNHLMGYFLENNLESGFHSYSKITNDIWKIFKYQDQVIYQSFNRFYYINKENKIHIERIREGNTTYAFPLDDQILFQVSYDKLIALNLKGNESILHDSKEISSLMIKHIDSLDVNTYLIGSLNKGLFVLENDQLKSLNHPLNDYLKTNQLNKAIRLNDDTFAFATMNGGIIIGSVEGDIKYIINKTNGLPNNRVHALELQNNEYLWIGTDNGISVINIQSPMLFLNNMMVDYGSFYDFVKYKKKYFIATNQGLYQARRNEMQSSFYDVTFVKGTEGQIWHIEVLDNILWIGHNNGTFLLKDDKLSRLSDISGGYSIVQSKLNPNIIYQSSYFGLAVYEKENNNWKYSYSLPNIEELTRDIIELNDGSLIVTGTNIAYQIWPNNLNKTSQIKKLTNVAAFNTSKWIRAFKVNEKIVLAASDTSVYFKDDKTIACSDALNQITYISEPIDDYCFIRKDNELQLYNFIKDEITPLQYDLSCIENDLIYKYEKIGFINNKEVFFCLSDRFGVANFNRLLNSPIKDQPVKTTNIQISNDRNGEIAKLDLRQPIPYHFNTLRFTFSSYNYLNDSEYEYFLKGYNTEWQQRSNNTAVFQNLKEGSYTFMVREKNKSNVTEVAFSVASPYYRSTIAYILYFILFLTSILLMRLYYKYALKKQRLVSLEKERKKLNQQRMMQSKRKLNDEIKELQDEVSTKTDRLSNLLIQNNKKKEVIDKINDELKQIKENQRFANPRQIEKLSKMIKSNFDEKKDWLVFEAAFSETHVNFFKKLRAKHANLTDEDLRLCAYLKVNLSSKELAPIFKITTRSVDLKKYRLKKKLGLKKEEKLQQYIMDFDS
ncbi:triple tyrosine motif-containing protein [Carboxylicivirga linearis]|uniref:Two component regulator three Y domain-containing protein n=1 Tax=Carboxylicivirga linearis TaxID=1628157 RepID=A0ABS5JZA6_9BACT|nr:triple tyrosine motif-containing protein [Carboxylicivirga linearis]MBS2099736.1 hypothetical protein [Carboxylicivirga linearis]